MTNELITTEARQHLKLVERNLKNKITEFSGYTDKSGRSSSGSAGLAIQINNRIKLNFAVPREEFTTTDVELLTALLSKLIAVMDDGVADGLTRDAIKQNLYAKIKAFAALK